MDTVVVILGLTLVFGAYLRSERRATRKLASQHDAKLGDVLQEISLLRSDLVVAGVVARSAKLPPPAASPREPVKSPPPAASGPALPSVARKVVSVTRDDHPDHMRATVVAQPPTGSVGSTHEEPPSTKPSMSRRITPSRGAPAATAPSSSPRPVSFEDQVRRALARMESRIEVRPELEARWFARLRALGAELDISESDGPTEAQIAIVIRELYQAEADSQDARDASAPPEPAVPTSRSPRPLAAPPLVTPPGARPVASARYAPPPPVEPTAASPEDCDGPDEATRFLDHKSTAPGAKRHAPTLRSMPSAAPSIPRPAPSVDILTANLPTAGARGGDDGGVTLRGGDGTS
jgi:hypothetical protein